MNCCDGNGNCNQGRNCPVRQQRIKETNDAYINGKPDPDPYEDVIGTFKSLLIVLAVCIAATLLAYFL